MKTSVKNQITASMAQTSIRTYFVAVSYNGKSNADVPSFMCTVNANSKAVAEKRAIAQARAEFPRYSAFMAVAETLTPRKIKRFNRDFADMREDMKWDEESSRYLPELARRYVSQRLHEAINAKAELSTGKWYKMAPAEWYQCSIFQRCLVWLRDAKRCKQRLADSEFTWLMLLEMQDVINAK